MALMVGGSALFVAGTNDRRSTMRRALLRCAVSLAVVGAAGVALAEPASAGPPRKQACVGKTFASAATSQPFPGALGHLVGNFAKDPFSKPGLGDGIQQLQAGLVLDSTVVNACN
jgi:hypothetical protein